MSLRVALAVVVGLALGAARGRADVVELTNGNELKGEVVGDEGADPLVIKTPDGKLSFPKRMVKKVTREPGDQSKGGARPATEPPPPAPSTSTGAPPPAPTTGAPPPQQPPPQQQGWWERRAAFKTKLTRHGPSPQPDPQVAAPDGVEAVNVPVGSRPLKAWLLRPPATGRHQPSVVWLHGGFAVTPVDFEVVRPLVAAGFVVLVPSFRGENGNKGDFELMLGELDDAIAVVRWFARQPGVDPARIHAVGFDVGGALSALLSLVPDVPLVHTSSFGGLYDPQLLQVMHQNGWVPFEGHRAELDARLFLGHLAEMQRPHIAWIGTEDKEFARAGEAIAAERAQVQQKGLVLRQARGDHDQSVQSAMADYVKILVEQQKETGR